MNQRFSFVEIASQLGDYQTSPEQMFHDDDGRIAAKTGISKIHRSNKSAFDLAVQAVGRLSGLPNYAENIRFVIYVTQSPSYFLPNHASRIQHRFNLNRSSMCFDINQGCSGFVQALVALLALLKGSNALGLIVCADTYSHHLAETDRSTQVLFSDGASATVVAPEGPLELIGVSHLTDGSGADLLVKPIAEHERLKMDGASIFHWTRNELGRQIRALLSSHGLKEADVDEYVLHQASKLVLDNVIKSLGIQPEKVSSTLSLTGNLVSSSIPFLLENHHDIITGEKNLIMAGFGVGLSSTVCLIRSAA